MGDNDFVSDMLNLIIPYYVEDVNLNVTKLLRVIISEVWVRLARG